MLLGIVKDSKFVQMTAGEFDAMAKQWLRF